jgi:hypothetical protein
MRSGLCDGGCRHRHPAASLITSNAVFAVLVVLSWTILACGLRQLGWVRCEPSLSPTIRRPGAPIPEADHLLWRTEGEPEIRMRDTLGVCHVPSPLRPGMPVRRVLAR